MPEQWKDGSWHNIGDPFSYSSKSQADWSSAQSQVDDYAKMMNRLNNNTGKKIDYPTGQPPKYGTIVSLIMIAAFVYLLNYIGFFK